MSISIEAIGVVRSVYVAPEGMPIQAAHSDAVGSVEIYPQYVDGMGDLEGFDH